jgi:hypothetical protein
MTSLDMAASPATLDRIRRHLVGLNMPRALEVIEHILRRIERGEISALEAIDTLPGEELTPREGRRVRSALKMGRLITIKTLSGFDFSFQPSLDRDRIMALAQLDLVDRHEAVHFLGQPGCGKTHLDPSGAGPWCRGGQVRSFGLLRHPGRHRQFARQGGAGGHLARTPPLSLPAPVADRR